MRGGVPQGASPFYLLLIPRVFHRIWLGGPEPEWTRGFASTWDQPGWELRQWGEAEIESLFPLRNQSVYDRAPRLCPNNVGQLRSDVLRYEILERFGGVYVDADFECLRPIDGLIEGLECFFAWEEQGRWIANGLMGAVPTHPFIERLIQGLPANVRRHRGGKPTTLSGPQYVTRSWQRDGSRVRVLNQAHFYPFGWREIAEHMPNGDSAKRWPECYAVHWWANKRRERGVGVG